MRSTKQLIDVWIEYVHGECVAEIAYRGCTFHVFTVFISQDHLRHWSDQIENSCRSMLEQSSTAVNGHSTDQTTKHNEADYVSVTSSDNGNQVNVSARVTSRTPSDVREININDGH